MSRSAFSSLDLFFSQFLSVYLWSPLDPHAGLLYLRNLYWKILLATFHAGFQRTKLQKCHCVWFGRALTGFWTIVSNFTDDLTNSHGF